MFGLGTGELMVIVFGMLLLFGANKLPELGRGLGQGMRSFRDALRGADVTDADDADSKPTKAQGDDDSGPKA